MEYMELTEHVLNSHSSVEFTKKRGTPKRRGIHPDGVEFTKQRKISAGVFLVMWGVV